ncbi:dihydrofolate reductase family protein [Arthrobacter sp. D1-29]
MDSVSFMGTVFGGMAASLDGYIRSETGDLSWLNNAMAKDEDYGFEETSQRTGAYVMGANTYREVAGTGGMGSGAPSYVVTHDRSLPAPAKTTLFSGDLRELVADIKASIPDNKDICVFGGSQLLTQFIELELLDELGISIIPVVLGGGVPFLGRTSQSTKLELLECRSFPSGIVLLSYRLTYVPAD